MEYFFLKDICDVKTGKLDANAATENGAYPFFTCSKEVSRIDKYAYDCPCVLLAGNGEFNVHIYKGKFNAYQRTYIITIKPNVKYNLKLIYYTVKNSVEHLKRISVGGVIKFIKLGDVLSIKLPKCSFEEQEKVTALLDSISSSIDKSNSELKLFDELIESRFVELFGNPENNPKGYEIKQFSNLGLLARGKSKHRPRNDPKLLGGQYPLIQTGDVSNADLFIKEYQSTYSEFGLKQSKMWPKGTLCITIAANIAESAILSFDSCFPDSVVGFTPFDDVNTVFMKYQLDALKGYLNNQATAVAQKNLNLEKLSSTFFIVPPIVEQDRFEQFVASVYYSKNKIKCRIDVLKELLNKKMDEYFEGEA